MGRAFEFRKARKMKRWSSMAKSFTRITKDIVMAVKEGGPDPSYNPKLRAVIQNSKALNMPKENVERAINKSGINKDIIYNNLRYEGMGPGKISIIVETLTDNKNRTASNVRTIFQKNGGSLGTHGSASHNFRQIGVIRINNSEISDEKIFELALNSGAHECISKNNIHEIQCDKNNIYVVKKELEKNINNFLYTGLEWLPLVFIEKDNEEKENIIKFLDNLEDDDDVQNVYSNLKF